MMCSKVCKTIMVAAIVGASIFPCMSLADEKPVSDKAAEVNGKTIPIADFERQLEMFKQQVLKGQSAQLPEALNQRLKDQVINKMIADELLSQQAAKQGIKIEDQTIEDEIKKIKNRFGDENQYQGRLKAVGMTEKKLRAQIKQQAAISKLIENEIVPKIKITPDDAKKYYAANTDKFGQPERVRAQHILLKVEKDDSADKKADTRKKLQDIQKKILAGEDFSSLAKEHSQGPSNVRGGDLGYFTRGRMVKPFEDVAFKLAPNEVSDIVETQFGYHLIKVLDHQPQNNPSFDEIKPKIMSFLFNEQVQKQLEPYVYSLREKSKIHVYVK